MQDNNMTLFRDLQVGQFYSNGSVALFLLNIKGDRAYFLTYFLKPDSDNEYLYYYDNDFQGWDVEEMNNPSEILDPIDIEHNWIHILFTKAIR
jgi:hypothetical protein